MTTIPMPRTVGHVTSDPSQADMDVDLPAGTCLLTTTQAEAYADARVREALEEVIQRLDAETAVAREHKAYAAVLELMSQAELIRVSLGKPLPGPVEP